MSTQVSWIVGLSLRAVRHDDETDEWVFDFGEHVLRVASPWRVMEVSGISLGDCDHRQQFGLPRPVDAETAAYDLLKDRVVVRAEVADSSADLTVDFGESVCLEVFNNSSGYEGWTLSGPGGRLLVGQGGGRLVRWKGDG